MLLCTGRSSKVQSFTEVIAVGFVSGLQVAAVSRSRFTPCTEVNLSLVCGIAADDHGLAAQRLPLRKACGADLQTHMIASVSRPETAT